MLTVAQCLTELGKQRLELAYKYNLEGFYQFCVGNFIIEREFYELEKVRTKIDRFLKDNTDWVMGFECDGDEYYVYITTRKEVQE